MQAKTLFYWSTITSRKRVSMIEISLVERLPLIESRTWLVDEPSAHLSFSSGSETWRVAEQHVSFGDHRPEIKGKQMWFRLQFCTVRLLSFFFFYLKKGNINVRVFCLAQPMLSPSYIIGWPIYCFSCILVFKLGWNRMPTKTNKLLLFFQLKYCRDHKNYIWFEKKIK